MKKFVLGLLAAVIGFVIYQYVVDDAEERSRLEESSALIEQQVRNVSKLVVTEASYSHVYNYSNSRELLGKYLTADKKALVVVNADVSIAYDLSRLQYELEKEQKVLRITYIPEPEININPQLSYYDVTANALNPFNAADYNKIDLQVREKLRKKVAASNLVENAQNRLLSELSQFYVLVNSLGWTLSFNDQMIGSQQELEIGVVF
ncbi:MAG: DUF4230 domain-containing protein [Nonlabens sp.]